MRTRTAWLAAPLVAVLAIVLGAVAATPAAAYTDYPWTYYRSFTRPSQCLDGDVNQLVQVYLEPCNGGVFQRWHYTQGQGDLMLYQEINGNRWCLQLSTIGLTLHSCADLLTAQHWYVHGVNGHVYFENLGFSPPTCMSVPATGRFITLENCPDVATVGVPNRFAWDFFR